MNSAPESLSALSSGVWLASCLFYGPQEESVENMILCFENLGN